MHEVINRLTEIVTMRAGDEGSHHGPATLIVASAAIGIVLILVALAYPS